MFERTNPNNSIVRVCFSLEGFLVGILFSMLEKRSVGDSSAISFDTHNNDLIPIRSREMSGNEMLIVEGILGTLITLILLTKKSTK